MAFALSTTRTSPRKSCKSVAAGMLPVPDRAGPETDRGRIGDGADRPETSSRAGAARTPGAPRAGGRAGTGTDYGPHRGCGAGAAAHPGALRLAAVHLRRGRVLRPRARLLPEPGHRRRDTALP